MTQTRNLIVGDRYQRVFKTRLAPDSKAKGTWNTQKYVQPKEPGQAGDWQNAKGAYNAAGVGGSITGKGAETVKRKRSKKEKVRHIRQPRREAYYELPAKPFYPRQDPVCMLRHSGPPR